MGCAAMPANLRLTDELLIAYLDGNADDKAKWEIDRALVNDKEVANRIALLDAPIPAIRKAFDRLPDKAPGLTTITNFPSTSPDFGWLGGIIVISFLSGVFSGIVYERSGKAGWIELATAQQTLFSAQTVAAPALSPEQLEERLRQLGSAVSRDLTKLTRIREFELRSVQLLDHDAIPVVQITFADTKGTPISLYVSKRGEIDKPISFSHKDQLQLSQWRSDGNSYLIVGATDRPAMEALTASIANLYPSGF